MTRRLFPAVALLCCFACFAQQHPAAAPRTNAKTEQKPGTADRRGTDEASVAIKGAVSAAVTGQITSVKSPEELASEAHEREERAFYDRWTIGLVALTALATSVLAYFTLKLWRSTGQLVTGAEDTSKKDLRAYVALEHIFFNTSLQTHHNTLPGESLVVRQIEEIDPNDLRIRIRNHGRTPAHRMTIRCNFSGNPPEMSTPYQFVDLLVDEQMLHPNQFYERRVPIDPRFSARATGFYVVGRMTYHDVYGTWWITDFCYEYEGSNSFTPYGDHNRERGPFDTCPE